MTPAEVVAAFPGEAFLLEPPVTLPDGNVLGAGIDRHRWEGLTLNVRFVFTGGGLSLVSLRTEQNRYADAAAYAALCERLRKGWGPPLEESKDDAFVDTRQVRWQRGPDRVDVKYIPGVIAVIHYPFPPLASGPKSTPPPADAAQSTSPPCSGTLSGVVEASFTCSVVAAARGGEVTFEVIASGPVEGVTSFPPVVVSAPTPLAIRGYARRELRPSRASVTTSKGVTYSSSESVGGNGDLALQVQSLERDGVQTIVLATVRAHLVAAGADPKEELRLDLQFEAGFRSAQ